MIHNPQKGVSLIVTFLIMTILLGVVLSPSVILFNEIKIIRNIGDSVAAFYAAETGTERTMYFDRKQIPIGAERGFCSICSTCSSNDCQDCSVASTKVGGNGCDPMTCDNCQITYKAAFDSTTPDEKTYSVNATVTPDPGPGNSIFGIRSKGFYKDTARAIELISTN